MVSRTLLHLSRSIQRLAATFLLFSAVALPMCAEDPPWDATIKRVSQPPLAIDPRVTPGQHFETAARAYAVRPELTFLESDSPPLRKTLREEVRFGDRPIEESLSQLRQAVTALPGGGFAVAWRRGGGTEGNVYVQILTPNGERVFPSEGLPLGSTNEYEVDPVIIAHAVDGFFVAFLQNGSIRVHSFSSQGTRRWDVGGVRVAASPVQRSPHLVADRQGGVFVCWITEWAPYCQRLDSAGSRLWGPDGQAAGGRPGLRALPRGILGAEDDLQLFWTHLGDIWNDVLEVQRIEGQRFSADGQRLWGPSGLEIRKTNLAETNRYLMTIRSVVPDGYGGAIVSFNDWVYFKGRNLDVVAQRISPEGSRLWGSGAPVATTALHHQNETAVATLDGGAVFAVFAGLGRSQSRVFLHRLDADGQHVWPVSGIELSDPASTALNYSAHGALSRGILYFGWTHQKAPSTFDIDVHIARFTLDGTRLDAPEGVPLTTATDAQFLHGLAIAPGLGRSLVIWDDRRKGTWDDLDVYGSLFVLDARLVDGFESGSLSAWSSPSLH